MTHWCILRCSPSKTLRLAETLAQDGFEVWTPVEVSMKRVPRANARRQVRLPIMPSYVFARAHHLIDLIELSAMPVKPRRGAGLLQPAHADFSVMHCGERIPFVGEEDLTHLRRIEAKRTPIPKAQKPLPVGLAVRVNGGSFGGMAGVVERSDRGKTLVCFNGRYTVRVATSLLSSSEEHRLAA